MGSMNPTRVAHDSGSTIWSGSGAALKGHGVGREGVVINRGFKENIYGVGSAGTPRHCRVWLGSRWLRGRKEKAQARKRAEGGG